MPNPAVHASTKGLRSRRRKGIQRPRAHRGPNINDATYKLLFSDREMVEHLLRDFVTVTGALRFETLERYPDTHINRNLRERREDLIWRVRSRNDDWCYIYILAEFQSQSDPSMPARIDEYVGVFLSGLYRTGVLERGDRLPLIVPVVIYNGIGKWRSSRCQCRSRYAACSPSKVTFCLT